MLWAQSARAEVPVCGEEDAGNVTPLWGRLRSFTGLQLALLASGFLVNVLIFSVYPYMAVLLRDRMDIGMEQVGLILGVATFVQFAGGLPCAALAERIGLQRSLLIAMALMTASAAGFLAGGPALTVAALFVRSVGTALYSPAVRGYLVHGAREDDRPRLVSASYATGNLGIALGPVVGAPFVHDPTPLFAAVTVLYIAMTIGHALLPGEPRDDRAPAVEPLRRALHGLAVLPFAVTALTLYLHMHFYQYLSAYAEGRVPTAFYGTAMMGYSLGLAVVQPLLASRVGRMPYTRAMAIGFGGLALGMAAFAGGQPVNIAAGIVAISIGNSVLFLKNILEALARTRRSPTVVFGQQRLAEGTGSFLSGAVGGGLYSMFERAGHLPAFWLAIAAECVVLPPLVLLADRRIRRPAYEIAGS
jgi:predicted MFS family arabinose efflux permease